MWSFGWKRMVYMHSSRVSKVSIKRTDKGNFQWKIKITYFLLLSHVDQKIDGMCLKEGPSDDDLVCCNVHTVGEKRLLQRKLSELVGKPRNLKIPWTFHSLSLNCVFDLSFQVIQNQKFQSWQKEHCQRRPCHPSKKKNFFEGKVYVP